MEAKIAVGTHENNTIFEKIDFTIDIGTKAGWVSDSKYKGLFSKTFQDTDIKKDELADDGFYVDGTGGLEAFYIQDNINASNVAFLIANDQSLLNQRGPNGIGLSRKTIDGKDDLATSLSKNYYEDSNMFAIEYLDESNQNTGKGILYFGDLEFLTQKKKVISNEVPLYEFQNFEHKWAVQMKYIFFGSILDDRTKKGNGVYKVSKDIPNLKIENNFNKAFFETVYGKIFFPNKYLDQLKYYLDNEYFLGNGLRQYCTYGNSLLFDKVKTYICREDEFSKLGQIHFIFGNGDSENKLYDIYLDYYDLFVPVNKDGDKKFEFLIGFHDDIPDTFRLGIPIFKKFTSIFDVKSKTLTLASLSNQAYVQIEPKSSYKEIEFTLMKKNNYLMTSVLVGKPQKEIMFSIDIGSPKTWVNQSSYNLESQTFKNGSEDSLNNTLYDLQGINAQDTFEYGNVTLQSFDFFLAEKVHYVESVKEEQQTHAVLGLGKYKKEEMQFSIINRLCKSNVFENQETVILEFGGDDPEGEKIGRIIYGDISDFIKRYQPHIYKVPIKNNLGTYGKWYVVLKNIFIGNILKEKKRNGHFKVSTIDYPHILINKGGTFESNLNKIVLPYNRKEEIMDILNDYYLLSKCKQKESNKIYTFTCGKEDINMVNEIHFVLDTGFDIYLKSEDMFDCTSDTCELLIEFRPEYSDSFVFGVSLLKKFKILLNTTYDNQSLSLVSTDNIDYLDLYTPTLLTDELLAIPFNSNGVLKSFGTVVSNNVFGSNKVNVPLTIDIGSLYTWVEENTYKAEDSRYYGVKEESKEYHNLDYSIYGKFICDNVKFGGSYLQNLSFIYASRIEKNNDIKTSLGLAGRRIEKDINVVYRLYELEFPELENNVSFLLHFNEPDKNTTNGLFVFGDFENYLKKKKDISQELNLIIGEGKDYGKWIVEFKYIIFKNILVNRTNDGKFLVDISTPKYILPNGTKAYFETIYHEILFPYDHADQYFELFKKHYFTVNGQLLCENKTSSELQPGHKKKYFECKIDEFKKLGQLHFIITDNVDIYLDNKDLFYCDYTNNICHSYFQANEENKDRFIFGFSLFKKFETLFNLDLNTITLIGEDNFDQLEFKEEKYNPIEQMEFTYNISQKLFLANALFGSQQKQLNPVIDIGSKISWISTDHYSYDESLYSEKGEKKEFKIDNYTINGYEINDTVVFNTLRIDKFNFINTEPPIGDLKLPDVIGFGRVNEYEINKSIVYLINKLLNSTNEYKFMLQFDEDLTNNQSTGQIVFGDYYNDYIKEKEYLTDVELTQPNEEYKWATTISRIYFDNILIHKSKSGLFNVSNNLNFINLNDQAVNLETKYDDIKIPMRDYKKIFEQLKTSYLTKACNETINDNDIYFLCPKEELSKIKEIHFILKGNENDIYFYPHDIFSCQEFDSDCKLLITANKNHNGDYIFGNIFLKKFYTLFDLNDTTKIQIYGKKNKAKIKLVPQEDIFVDPMEKKKYGETEDTTSSTVTVILIVLLCIFILTLGAIGFIYFFKISKKSRTVVVVNENGSFGKINDSKFNELNSQVESNQ